MALSFWDSSAIVALILDEEGHAETLAELMGDPVMVVWWGALVECASAIARREREGALEAPALEEATRRLHLLADDWHEILPSSRVRRIALRVLRTHPLRAADSLQLAAALVAAGDDPRSARFICLDRRLADAAGREGLVVPLR